MWPYTDEERSWLETSKDGAQGRPLPKPANDDDRAEDTRPVDPQIFISK